ncbi:hypothetical protein F3F96_08115 [Mariprofundus sp. NF]|uniref:hypothetical protein n=1 Tax=Mariprofundus sp. NF TaxID=2608716 RepID=UPI0015A21B02|nr:hypothetical protein [Mariprofundus sp. NF]NWF39096.1 hypothetical protein [Mariprofundus sp. NF]
MSEIPFLSYLSSINWSDGLQWYFNHLDAGYLLRVWAEGGAFTHEDWMSVMLLSVNLIAAISLTYYLIRRDGQKKSHASNEVNHSQTTGRAANKGQENIEPRVSTLPA